MRRVLSVCLVFIMLLGVVPFAFADEAESQKVAELILIAKDKLEIDDSIFAYENYHRQETAREILYSLNWKSRDELASSSVYVTINANGDIINYHLYNTENQMTKPKFPKKTEEEALSAAKQWLARVAKDKSEQIAEEDIRYYPEMNVYHFTAERVLGEFPVYANNVSIQLNADTLTVTDFYVNWDNGLVPAEKEIISPEKAKEIFASKAGYELFYQVVAEKGADSVHKVFRPKYDESLYVDATSGELVNFEQMRSSLAGGTLANKNEAMMDSAADRLSPEELEMVGEIAKMLSHEKAESIARGISEFGITKDFISESFYIVKGANGTYVAQLSFAKKDKDAKDGFRNVTMNAMTGEVLSFSGYYAFGDEKATISDAETEKLAKAFLDKYYSEKAASIVPKELFTKMPGRAEYQRVENGIRFYNNGMTLEFHPTTKQLSYFSLNWTEAEMPTNEACPVSAANEKALADENFRARYYVSYSEGKEVKTSLCYAMENAAIYDAESLKPLSRNLKPQAEESELGYDDHEGHYARAYADRLLTLGIGYAGRALRPDESVTQYEYLELVMQAVLGTKRYDNDKEAFYQYLLRTGVLEKGDVRPEEAITRIEGVRYLLNALGYREFAQIEGIFLCPFADVSKEDQGYGAIAAGLGLVYGKTDTFYASTPLKRGDALIILHNYLSR